MIPEKLAYTWVAIIGIQCFTLGVAVATVIFVLTK